jgi:hypothetical protein
MVGLITIRVWQVLCVVLLTLLALASFTTWWQTKKVARLEAAATNATTQASLRLTELQALALKERKAMQDKVDGAALALAENETKRKLDYDDLQQKLKQQTSGRECLSAKAVALLNRRTADVGMRDANAAGGSAASAQAASADPAAGADAGGVATDTDIAGWAASAQALYGQCAGRLKGWQDWYADLPPVLK